jgi:hypothetical protein
VPERLTLTVVFLLRLREQGLEASDPVLIARMGRQEGGGLRAATGHHLLPEQDRGLWVVAGLSHQRQADPIGLEFLAARERQKNAVLGAGAEELAGRLRVGVASELKGSRDGANAELRDLCGADALRAMTRDYVSNLMSNHGGEFGIVATTSTIMPSKAPTCPPGNAKALI